MLELFQNRKYFPADDGTISDGFRELDGRIYHAVEVDVAEGRGLVVLAVRDAVQVEAFIDPYIAMCTADALISAALTMGFRFKSSAKTARGRRRG